MTHQKNRPTKLFVSLVAGLLTVPLAAHAERSTPAASINASASVTLAKPMITRHLPDEVANGQARFSNYLEESRALKFAVSLPVRNPQDLEKLFSEVSDPKSANYRKYLSSEQFNDRFAPKQADYDAVVAWAKSNGFTVRAGSGNRRVVALEGSVGAVNRAFNVNMSEFQHPRENRTYFSPDREPTARGLGVTLLHVTGLQNFVLPVRHLQKAVGENISKASQTGSGPSGSFTPTDMRAAYYGNGSLTGAGQSVGVFSFDGYLASDLTLYYSSLNWHPTVPVNNVMVSGFNGACTSTTSTGAVSKTCDDGEQILDIVNVIGMAPGLTQVLFYEGTSDTEILNQMATDNKAKILSSSWGWSPADASADDPIFKQMGVQGQTFLNATGDEGQLNSSTYDFPSVDPYILQVGGTQLSTASAGGAWASETAWAQQSEGGASAGGYISGTSIPSWQQTAGVINASNAGSTTLRNSPDVAAEASFNSSTADNGKFQTGYGGTSFAAPRWAGYLALVNQQAVANGQSTIGFINPTLYSIGLSSSFTTDFHDVTSGNNKPTEGSGSGFNAVTGYDLVTGWGSPNGANLLNALAGGGGVTPPPPPPPPTQLLANTGFETGTASPWTLSSGVLCSNGGSGCSSEVAHTGTYFAYLDGYGAAHTDTASQKVTITAGKTKATLSYYVSIDSTKTGTAQDKLTVQVLNSSGSVLATLATLSNLNAASGYVNYTADMTAYIGQTVTIKFTGTESSSSGNTDFLLDDVTLTVQ